MIQCPKYQASLVKRGWERGHLAISTTKKAIVWRFDQEPVRGFLNVQEYLQPTGAELLTPSGNVTRLPYREIKGICYVREFDTLPEPVKTFHSRPRVNGLWIRMSFRDGDSMEGVLPNSLLSWDLYGYLATPPESHTNIQKIFVPRQALTDISVLGVVGSPLKRKARQKPVAKEQIALFD